MTERPILMSAPMVSATLDDLKNQTRRIIQCPRSTGAFVCVDYGSGWWPYVSVDGESFTDASGNETAIKCPYGRVGDRLWVRETFYAFGYWTKEYSDDLSRDVWQFHDKTLERGLSYQFLKPADVLKRRAETEGWYRRPAIFMPRVASRITLQITGLRVERLQNISEADAIGEGFRPRAPGNPGNGGVFDWYRELWGAINGAGSWDTNPWVWVLSSSQRQ